MSNAAVGLHNFYIACRCSVIPPFPIEASASMGSLFPDLAGAEQRKTAGAFLRLLSLCQRRAIFPGRRQPSIVATDELNFRVRNGNGWTLIVIGTDFGDPCGNRTHVWGVRGLRLNLLTNGPRPCGSRRLRFRGFCKCRENLHVLDPSSYSNRSGRFDLISRGKSGKMVHHQGLEPWTP